jgi:hypothetical protein
MDTVWDWAVRQTNKFIVVDGCIYNVPSTDKQLEKENEMVTKSSSDILSRFRRFDPTINKRLIVALEGPPKVGKTRFPLTFPGPIVVMNTDRPLEGQEEFARKKDIYFENYNISKEFGITEYKQLWDRYESDFYAVCDDPAIRTIVLDTFTEARNLALLGLYGRTTQIQPFMYGPANALVRSMVKYAGSTDKNFVFTHQMKAEYDGDKATGKLIRNGIDATAYFAQINCAMFRERNLVDGKELPGDFVLRITDCGQNGTAAGAELRNELIEYKFLASTVYADTTPEDWE